MLVYHFSNDARFEQVEENLISIATHLQTGQWNHSKHSIDNAKNGFYPLYELIFGLFKDSNNVKLIMNGEFEKVLVEYAKKYQYPNPRQIKVNTMEMQLENGQCLAPIRIIIKLLFLKTLENKEPVITIDEIQKYILSNEKIARNEIDVYELYNDIKSGSVHSGDEYEYYGGEEPRFIKSLIGLLNPLAFLNFDRKNNSFTMNFHDLNTENKKYIFEIISYNEFWDFDRNLSRKELAQPYMEYMQADVDEFKVKENKEQYFSNSEDYNVIYYGAPGTGKSYEINKKIKEVYPEFENDMNEESQYVFRTTLHPEYTYSDFVGQIMPEVKNDRVTYEFFEGIFTEALKKALEVNKESKPVFLVLEEMSRANVAAVFGDLFQLLDRQNGESEYHINHSSISEIIYQNKNKKIFLPDNLYLYGSVNTSDQNVFVMDTAFKRRFEWKYISTKPVKDINNPSLNVVIEDNTSREIDWHSFYQKLNLYITNNLKLNEDKQIGQFFVKFSGHDSFIIKEKFRDKLLNYLWEDIQKNVYNNIRLFQSNIENFSDLYQNFENDQVIFSQEFLNVLFNNESKIQIH